MYINYIMALKIEPSVCQLMKNQINKTNGQFYDIQYITTKEEWEKVTKIKTMKNINGSQIKTIPQKEWEKMRYEEFCFIHHSNGKYNAYCNPLENMNGRLAGGVIHHRINIPSTYTKNVYDFHNHPLFRENFPNGVDISTSFLMAMNYPPNKLKDVYSCVGGMDYKGKSHVLCYKFNKSYRQKSIDLGKEKNDIERRLEERYDRGEITEKEWKKIYDSSKPLKFHKSLQDSLEKRWNRVMDENLHDDLGYLVKGNQNDDGSHTYSFYPLPSEKQRKKLTTAFKKEFSDVLEFGEC